MADVADIEYEWFAKSECPVCTGMEGIYDSPPPRPHPHCQCTIATYLGTFGGDRCTNEWYFEQLENEFIEYPEPIAITHWLVTVWCWDGSAYEEETTIEYKPKEEPWWWDSVVDQLEDMASDMARSECPLMDEECHGVQ
jgi:hypothetical protein